MTSQADGLFEDVLEEVAPTRRSRTATRTELLDFVANRNRAKLANLHEDVVVFLEEKLELLRFKEAREQDERIAAAKEAEEEPIAKEAEQERVAAAKKAEEGRIAKQEEERV